MATQNGAVIGASGSECPKLNRWESETREEKREMDENEIERLRKENVYIGRLWLPVHVTIGRGFWVWAYSIQLVLFHSVYTWRWRYRLMPIFNDVPSLLLHN